MIWGIMPKILHLIDLKIRIVITICLSLFPLIFLPLFPEAYDTAKWVFLVLTASILLILLGVRAIVSRSLVVPKSVGIWAFALLSAASLVSLLFGSNNKVEGLLQPLAVRYFCL
jgi:hypothetical protein